MKTHADTWIAAVRRRRPPAALSLPTTRLGYPHTGHPHNPLHHGRRQFSQCGHDTEQQEEGP